MEAVIGIIVFIAIVSALFGGGDNASGKAKVSTKSKSKPKSKPQYSFPKKGLTRCPKCHGTGVVTERRQVPSSHGGYEVQDYPQTCNRCWGKGTV